MGVRLPKSLSSEDFQRWLNSYRSIGREKVQVEIVEFDNNFKTYKCSP